MVHKVDSDGATDDGRFQDGDPDTGVQPTQLSAKWHNMVGDEICNVVTEAGIDLDDEDNAQLLAAIRLISTPIGVILPYTGTVAPDGWLMAGQTGLLRATYSRLWTWVSTVSGNLAVDGADYIANPGKYGIGNGATTFDLPRIDDFIKGLAVGDSIGHAQADQMQRIQGSVGHAINRDTGSGNAASGALALGANASGADNQQPGTDNSVFRLKTIELDTGSEASAGAGLRTGTYTRPRSVIYPYIIKY